MAVSKWFDSNVYMTNKLAQLKVDEPAANWTIDKVVQAFESLGFVGPEGAEAHFMQFGQFEDVAPNAFFNPTEYYRAKAAEVYNKQADPKSVTDTEAAFVKAAIKGLGMGAWTHYDTFGSNEKINPSNGFDTEKYMNAKLTALNANLADGQTAYKIEDVYAAFKTAGISALEHFMTFGGNKQPGEVAEAYNGTIPAAFAVDDTKKVNGGGAENGVTYTLTAGMDKASANVFVAEGTGAGGSTPTLNASDVLQGSGTDNVLKIYGDNAGSASFVSANISNIQKVIAYGTAAAGLDVSANADVKEVWAGQGANSAITANLNQKVGVQGKISSAAQVFTFTGAGGSNDSATVALDNADIITTVNALTIADVKNITMELKGTNKIPELQAVAMKTLTVSGAGSLETTINDLTGTNQLTKIDASAAKGDVKIKVAAVADLATSFTLNGGEGNDVFQMDDATTGGIKFTANLGKGDDKILLHTGVAVGTVIDGGEGNNTLVMTGYTSAAGDKDLFKNFQNIELINGTSYTYGHIAGIENFSAKTGSVTINGLKENASVTANGALTSLTMDVKDTTDPANTVTLKLDNGLEGKAADDGVVVGAFVTNADILNINSVGNINATENKITLSGASLTGLDKVIIQESSTQGFHLDAGAATVLTYIDGSKSSANLTIDFDSAVGTATTHTSYTIKTGSGNDTILGSAAGTGAPDNNKFKTGTINAGLGGDDIDLGDVSTSGVKHTVVYTSAADSKFDATGTAGVAGAGTMDKIDNFNLTTNDKIDVSAIAGLTQAKGLGSALTASAATMDSVLASIAANGFGGKSAVAVKFSDGAQTVLFFDVDGNGKFEADADLAIQLVGDKSAIAVGDINWASA